MVAQTPAAAVAVHRSRRLDAISRAYAFGGTSIAGDRPRDERARASDTRPRAPCALVALNRYHPCMRPPATACRWSAAPPHAALLLAGALVLGCGDDETDGASTSSTAGTSSATLPALASATVPMKSPPLPVTPASSPRPKISALR